MNTQTLALSSEIDAHMTQSGIPNNRWYVGITSNVQERLFGYHRVSRQNDTWIYRHCLNATEARDLEAAYHRAGCKGDTGGGDATCCTIYAYVVTMATVE
jgi:hypothetical protein